MAEVKEINGDDPEAVVYCARIAVEFRQKFNRDIVIDMICYRRFGHNEGDEPSFTQPMMYQKIKKHPSTLYVYAEKLIKEGTISKEEFLNMKTYFKNLLDEQFKTAKEYKPKLEWFEGIWSRFKPQRGKDRRGITGVTIEEIKKIGKILRGKCYNFFVRGSFYTNETNQLYSTRSSNKTCLRQKYFLSKKLRSIEYA